MTLARVLGPLTATTHHPALNGAKLLLVQPVSDTAQPQGRVVLVIDRLGAGVGDLVLVVEEGAVAAEALGFENPPVRSVIVGIAERVDVLAQEAITGVA